MSDSDSGASSADEDEQEELGCSQDAATPDNTSDTEAGEPTVVMAPKETAKLLVRRFQALLRAGQHSSGSRYQLAVHSGRLNDRKHHARMSLLFALFSPHSPAPTHRRSPPLMLHRSDAHR